MLFRSRELLKLIMCNVNVCVKDKLPLPKLYDKLEAHLRALESMGIELKTNAAWLYPLIESSLSEDILKAWQRSNLFTDVSEGTNSRILNLMEFLKREVVAEERLILAKQGFEKSVVQKRHENKPKFNQPTAANLFSFNVSNCIFCDKPHDSKECRNATSMSVANKINKVKQKRCCLKCLKPGHIIKNCRSYVHCSVCSKPHPLILCPDLSNVNGNSSDKTNKETKVVQNNFVKGECSKEVALMTIQVKLVTDKGFKTVRALFDCGSQKSYIEGDSR